MDWRRIRLAPRCRAAARRCDYENTLLDSPPTAQGRHRDGWPQSDVAPIVRLITAAIESSSGNDALLASFRQGLSLFGLDAIPVCNPNPRF